MIVGQRRAATEPSPVEVLCTESTGIRGTLVLHALSYPPIHCSAQSSSSLSPRRDTKNAEGSGSDQENFKSGHTVQPTQLDRRAASPFQYQHNALMSGASEVR